MKSQVTTKSGDSGQTSTLGGMQCSKSHPIMHAVGTLDELRAHTAALRVAILDSDRADARQLGDFLAWLLHVFFPIGSALSDPTDAHPEYHTSTVTTQHLEQLEKEQDRLETRTPLPPAFVIGATTSLAAQADIACTVSRRLEREVITLADQYPSLADKPLVPFLNRLSDYLYILARFLEDGQHTTVDYSKLA